METLVTPVKKSILNGTVFENTPFDLWATSEPSFAFAGTGSHFYTPFNITIFKGQNSILKDKTLVKTFSHDVCHALDCFMQGKSNRLFLPEMGYGVPTIANWNIKMWETEVRVLAMQYALLKPSFSCVKFFTRVAMELFTTRLGTYKKDYDATSHVKKTFKKAKKEVDELKSAYQVMCDFIKQNQDKRVNYER